MYIFAQKMFEFLPVDNQGFLSKAPLCSNLWNTDTGDYEPVAALEQRLVCTEMKLELT